MDDILLNKKKDYCIEIVIFLRTIEIWKWHWKAFKGIIN